MEPIRAQLTQDHIDLMRETVCTFYIRSIRQPNTKRKNRRLLRKGQFDHLLESHPDATIIYTSATLCKEKRKFRVEYWDLNGIFDGCEKINIGDHNVYNITRGKQYAATMAIDRLIDEDVKKAVILIDDRNTLKILSTAKKLRKRLTRVLLELIETIMEAKNGGMDISLCFVPPRCQFKKPDKPKADEDTSEKLEQSAPE